MSILSSKERISSITPPEVPKSEKGLRSEVKELLGKEFHIIKNGLDPDEVIDFLESVAGSSDSMLKRLEHFTALQKASETMELMMVESKNLKERIKTQAELEAKTAKEQIIAEADQQSERLIEEANQQAENITEEAKHRCAEMMQQAKNVCISSIEGTNAILAESKQKLEQLLDRTKQNYLDSLEETNSTLLEAAIKAQEIQEMAVQKARDAALKNVDSLRQDVDTVVDSMRNDLDAIFKQFAGVPETSEAAKVDAAQSTAPKVMATSFAEKEPVVQNITEAQKPETLEMSPLLSEVNRNLGQYQGEVTLVIPQGVSDSWMRQLRQRMANMPNVRIRVESGDRTGKTVMTLFLSEPVALPAVLLNIPGVEDVIGESGPDIPGNGSSPRPERKTLTLLLSKS